MKNTLQNLKNWDIEALRKTVQKADLQIKKTKEARMGKPMFEERSYERKQEIQVRAARGGHVDSWVSARIETLTSKGAHVTITHTGRHAHILWKDMRSLDAVNVAATASSTFTNPVLTPEKVEAMQHGTKPATDAPAAQKKPPSKPTVDAVKKVASVTPIRPEPVPPVLTPTEKLAEEQNLVRVQRKSSVPKTPKQTTLVGALLKNARSLENLTQHDTAALIGSSQADVHQMELGAKWPDDDVLIAYCQHFELDVELLLAARDRPEDAIPLLQKPAEPAPKVITTPQPLPVREAPKPVEEPTRTARQAMDTWKEAAPKPLAMDDFFEFCDRVEAICPQPTDAALRKQWRELAQGLFNLRSKL